MMRDVLNHPYPVEPEEIREYLCALWKQEYPQQGISLPMSYSWERRVVRLNSITSDNPRNPSKARRYLNLITEDHVIFPPLVCLNGEVIDGMHRYWAMRKAGIQWISIYQNKPLKIAV